MHLVKENRIRREERDILKRAAPMRRMGLFAILLMAVLTAPFGPAASSTTAAGLVPNGSFETPRLHVQSLELFAPATVGAWELSGGGIDLVRGDYWQPALGNQSIDMDGAYVTGTIYQNLTTVPRTTYTISFSIAGNTEGPPVIKEVEVSFGGVVQTFSFDTTGHSDKNMGWVIESFDAVATDTTTRLQFRSLSPPGNAWGAAIDAVGVWPAQ